MRTFFFIVAAILVSTAACRPACAADGGEADRSRLKENLMRGWDDDLGMWWASWTKSGTPQHTTRVNSQRLLMVALASLWDEVPTGRVLRNLRTAQVKDGKLRGQFWWEYEDKGVRDGNAAFFNLSRLIPLYISYGDQMGESERAVLKEMLVDGHALFQDKIHPIDDDHLRYANAYLGDAVCLWLLKEALDLDLDAYEKDLTTILGYYRDQDWGWGEHLSDLYSKIIQDVLVVLLSQERRLSETNRDLARGLLRELRTIDEIFRGGPRVPSIRDKHALHASPRTPDRWSGWAQPYFDGIGPVGEGASPERVLAYQAGLKALTEPTAVPSGPWLGIACKGGIEALVNLTPRYRVGAFTAYPLYPDTNDGKHYGLASISRPVAFWHRGGDWAGLQYLTEEDGILRGHPMTWEGRRHARLSDRDGKARYGLTAARRLGDGLLVARVLPQVASSWTRCADRWLIVEPSHGDRSVDEVGGWQRLVLPYDQEVLTIAYLPLAGAALPTWQVDPEADQHAWSVEHRWEGPAPKRLGGLWFIQVGAERADPPAVDARDGDRCSITVAPGTTWRIDLAASTLIATEAP